MKKFIFGIVVLLFFISCTKKIDTSSDEAYNKSIEIVKNSLSPDKQKEFEEAMNVFPELERNKLNNKTAEEIIAESKKIIDDTKAKRAEESRQDTSDKIVSVNSVLLQDKIIIVEAEGTAIIGNGITIDDAKLFAINDAKRSALESVGTYIESNMTVIDHIVTKDEINAYTGSVLKTDIVSTENTIIDNQFALIIKIKATVDTEMLNNKINNAQKDSNLKEIVELEQQRNNDLTKQIEVLRKNKSREKAKVKEITGSLSATEWYNNGYKATSEENYELAVKYQTKAIKIDSKYALAYFDRGVAFWNLRKYKEAIEDFNKVLLYHEPFSNLFNNRALAYQDLGNNEQALIDYNKALELNPKNNLAYINRSGAFISQGEYKKAISDCNMAIAIDRNYLDAYNNRAVAYKQMEEYKQALTDYNKIIELDPKNYLPYLNRANLFEYIGECAKAMPDYTKAIELNPEYYFIYYNRGCMYLNKLKQYDRAIEDFTEAIELRRDDVSSWINRGLSFYYKKDYQQALENFSQAIKLNPMYANSYMNRGNVYNDLKEFDKAILDYSQAIVLDPKEGLNFNNRGCAYQALKKYKEAAGDFNEYLRMNGNNDGIADDVRATITEMGFIPKY